MKTVLLLDDWSICHRRSEKSLWTPADSMPTCLKGIVSGHPKFGSGKLITTSQIALVEGREITTKSGTIYLLGKVSQQYVKWCHANGIKYDDIKPVQAPQKN